MKNSIRLFVYIGFLGIAVLIGYNIYSISSRLPEKDYSTFLEEITLGKIANVTIKEGAVNGTDVNGREFSTYAPDIENLLPLLREKEVTITTKPPSRTLGITRDMLLVLLLIGGWSILNRKSVREPARFSSGKNFRSIDRNTNVTFDDVAGISEAREELKELITFLKDPGRFTKLGGRIPKGVLLEGPPGTGKTLLAKAIAGEASVPFYAMGGSDFVEMYAGLGASRVRELFTEAKKHAPCIIFIDEIDAIGGKRTGSIRSGSNDEREQTLNALLVEMDGFGSNETVIVVGATNRADILDSALLRPGRFDRQIALTLPDVKGRLKILEVHSKKVAIAEVLDLSSIARSIPGFSGAQIANLVNEAALLAARRKKQEIEYEDFEDAKDKITMGLERKSAVISEKSRRLAAYHEAGHAVATLLLPDTDPLHKITIIPRGQALGLTQQLPFDEQHTFSRNYLVNRIKILMGGRLAEELIFGQQTTGASNDIFQATIIAGRLVCEFGMSTNLGPVSYNVEQLNAYHPSRCARTLSEQTRREIDQEISRIIDDCCQETTELIRKNTDLLHMLAEALMANETLDSEEVDIVHRCYRNQKSMKSSQS